MTETRMQLSLSPAKLTKDFLLMVLWNTARSPLEQRSLFKSKQSSVIYELTQYNTSVHPSMVIHWNTVSIANAKLSKLVMPPFGPTHPPLHSVPFMTHWRPFPENAQGAGSSSTSISGKWPKNQNSEFNFTWVTPSHEEISTLLWDKSRFQAQKGNTWELWSF